MQKTMSKKSIIFFIVFVITAYWLPARALEKIKMVEPVRYSFEFNGLEREYYVWLPRNFDNSKTYWALVVAHGGGNVNSGLNFWMIRPMWRYAHELGLEAIIVSPTFDKSDADLQRYPIIEGQFLNEILDRVEGQYNLFPKILLTGYSRGGQFSHRFALWYPDKIKACAPFAAGSWTTPDGRLLDPSLGEIKGPKEFLNSIENKQDLPEKLRGPMAAQFGGKPALPALKNIPF